MLLLPPLALWDAQTASQQTSQSPARDSSARPSCQLQSDVPEITQSGTLPAEKGRATNCSKTKTGNPGSCGAERHRVMHALQKPQQKLNSGVTPVQTHHRSIRVTITALLAVAWSF
jgi:hypothetical protein